MGCTVVARAPAIYASCVTSTAAPDRNFDLSVEERVRAAVSGPPAFIRRLRTIEDLEVAIVRAIAREAERARREGADAAERMRERFPESMHRRLVDRIGDHNRYYPIEANLPIDLRTGGLLERDGTPWRARPCPSREELLARATATTPDGTARR
jgi:hypothetical protein